VKTHKLVLLWLCIALSLTPLGCGSSSGGGAVKIDNTAPDFTLSTLRGKPVQLTAYRGRPVVLNFFTTWCGYCEAELPDIEAIHNRYAKQGLVVIGVDVEETAREVAGFVNRLGISFPVLLDPDNEVADLYGVNSYPRTYFIEPNGSIHRIQIGSADKGTLESYVGELMALPREPTSTPAPPVKDIAKKSRNSTEGCVAIKQITVRDRPSINGAEVAFYGHDACLNFDARSASGEWLRLADVVSQEGSRLWAAAEYVDLKGDMNQLPIEE
jgi:peroxiredoxin